MAIREEVGKRKEEGRWEEKRREKKGRERGGGERAHVWPFSRGLLAEFVICRHCIAGPLRARTWTVRSINVMRVV